MFRALADHSQEFIGMCDLEFRPFYVNEAGRKLVGLDSLEDACKVAVQNYFFPEDRRRMTEDFFPKVLREGTGEVEIRFRHFKTGAAIWLIYNVFQVRGADGRVSGYATVSRDITGRKRAEEALAASRKQLQGVIDNIPALVYAFDREERFVMANATLAELLNSTPERMVGKRRHEFMPKEDADWHEANDRRVFESGRTLELEEHSQLKGRSITWLTAKFPLRDAQGNIYAVAGISTDITERKRAEEALRQRTEELQTILDTTPVAIFLAHDSECRKITGNPAAQQLVELPPEANISKSAPAEERPIKWQEMRDGVPIQPEDLPLQRAVRGQEIRDYEMDLVFEGGTAKSVVGHATPIRDGDGKPRGGVAVLMNITDRKRSEEALRQSEEKFKTVFDSNMVGVAFWRADGCLTDANQAFCDLIGYSPEEVRAGKARWSDVTPPEMLERDRQGIEEINATGVCKPYEKVFIHRDGHRRTIIVGGAMLGGKRDEGVAFAVDITERKRAEEGLRTSERLYRAIGESIDYGIWICDPHGRNTYASESFLKLVGLTQSECSEFGWGSVLHPEDAEATIAAWRECVRTGSPWYREHRFRGVDGAWHPILACGVPVRDERGEIVRWAGINLDIRRLKRTEEDLRRAKDELAETNANLEKLVAERTAKLQELVGELEHFSYTITHDLKSPLRAMRGFAEMARETVGQSEATPLLERISTSAERMDGLIADALSYSRSVRQELPLEDVDAGALLRGMLDSYPELQPSRARIQVGGRLPMVLANEAGLTQCFSNLLGNAVKFVKRGEMPEIRVWAEEGKPEVKGPRSEASKSAKPASGWVRIWVEDHGIGIAKEMLPRVFDMFSRGSKEYEGTGIGLALVRKVTQRMGGRVGVESEEGRGSRFWIELKSGEGERALAAGAGRPALAEATARRGTLLYVEDEESDAMFMERAFAGKGMLERLRVVRDGRAAIHYLSGSGEYSDRAKYPLPEVVLLDLNLPHVPGFEVLQWMRNHPDFVKTPVVVFSSSTREDDRVRAQELGANDFVSKPSSGLKFGEVVEGLRGKWMRGE